MEIYGRPVPSAEEVYAALERLMADERIWHQATFVEAAKACGLKRVLERKSGYFVASAFRHGTVQAPFDEGLIEEIRLFIGNEPAGLSDKDFKRDRHKIGLLGKEYIAYLKTHFDGTLRESWGNFLFESERFRIRVLALHPVWVVLSSFEVMRQLSRDYWSEEEDDDDEI